MMIGDRLRRARLAAGLTLDEVVARLAARGRALTKAGLSKYERGGSTPSASLLLLLASVLGVRPTYFTEESSFAVTWVAFRAHSRLTQTRQERIKAVVGDLVAGQLGLQTALYPGYTPTFPKASPVCTPDEAEDAATRLRGAWELGTLPIDSVTQTVEDNGGVVVGWDADEGQFDGLSGWANDLYPVTVVNRTVSVDRQRFNLAHELGHLVMRCETVTARDEEKLAHRFASAFLMPAKPFLDALGTRRRHLDPSELALLKGRYGISMGALAHRAKDLDVIDDGHYQTLCREFSRLGWRRREPFPYMGTEESTRLQQMTLHALAEGVITREDADRLCPGCVELVTTIAEAEISPQARLSARALMRLPREDRDRVLAAAAAEAEVEYRTDHDLTDFAAFGEDDYYDATPAR